MLSTSWATSWSLLRKHLSQMTFPTTCPQAIYSASVIKVDIVFYFLLYQDMTTLLKK